MFNVQMFVEIIRVMSYILCYLKRINYRECTVKFANLDLIRFIDQFIKVLKENPIHMPRVPPTDPIIDVIWQMKYSS